MLRFFHLKKSTMDFKSSLKMLQPILKFWKTFVVICGPLCTLPLVLGNPTDQDGKDITKAYQCAYVMLNMAIFWVTEAIPLGITSIVPVVMLPLFGIMTTDAVGKEYLKETNMMFISGIVVAIAVEHCNLHKRVALKFLLLVGTSPRRLMLGFMLPTMFLSMWISNTATTAMMVKIVKAVLDELEKDQDLMDETLQTSEGKSSDSKDNIYSIEAGELELESDKSEKVKADNKNRRHMSYLAVAYAANTGGTGTLTGTGSNLILKGTLSELSTESPINFASWMAYAVVPMLLNLFFCWIWLQMFYIGIPWRSVFRRKDESDQSQDLESIKIRTTIQHHYNSLGRMNFHEAGVLTLFIFLVMLWLFRDPQFIKGWGEFFITTVLEYKPVLTNCTKNCTFFEKMVEKDSVDDASAGMAIVILLFVIPRSFKGLGASPPKMLLDWKSVEEKMPWELVFLLGGGFALAKGTSVSGLSTYLGSQLESLRNLQPWIIVLVVSITTAAATEITSNVATCSIILPVLKNLSLSLEINPIYLMLPVTLCCSYAFMLPVATPPNAIVYKASGMKTSEMMKVGFGMNIICVTVNILWLESFGKYFFNLSEFPEWANPRNNG